MKWIFRQLGSMRRELNILLAVAIVTIILTDFVFIHYEQLFFGGEKLGELVEKLMLSYISSYVFYFVVVHLKSRKDKKNIYPFLIGRGKGIVGDAIASFNEMSQAIGSPLLDELPNDEQIKRVLCEVNPQAISKMLIYPNLQTATIIQYLEYRRSRTRESIDQIYTQMPYLESEFIKLLIPIENCSFYQLIKTANQIHFKNKDMTAMHENFSKYIKAVRELKNYIDESLVPHG